MKRDHTKNIVITSISKRTEKKMTVITPLITHKGISRALHMLNG